MWSRHQVGVPDQMETPSTRSYFRVSNIAQKRMDSEINMHA